MAEARQLRRLIDYNEWADGRILAAIEGMADAELARPAAAYFGSLAENLRHTLVAQQLWLARWTGVPGPGLEDRPSGPWRAAYAASHTALRAFVATLTDADTERVVSYVDSKGRARSQRLDQLVVHLVNHGTAHRAETGLLLERAGRSPGDLNYLYFCFERPA